MTIWIMRSTLVSIAGMLMGLDFKYQADLVSLLREEHPDVAEVCRLFALSRSECDELDPVIQHLVLSDDEIMLLWETRRNEAANSGTWAHAMLENMFNGYQTAAGEMQGELGAAVKSNGRPACLYVACY